MQFFHGETNNDPEFLNNQLEKQKWLDHQYAFLGKLIIENKRIPFKIIDIKETGFLAKVYGLYAFISFFHMPWSYSETDYWKAVFPKITGKIFFCKIFHINRDPTMLKIDGSAHHFKKLELIENVNYVGIIIHKTETYLLIDIGYNFGWDCGSLVGILHIRHFKYCKYDKDYDVGKEIEVKYYGTKENGQVEFSKDTDDLFWINEEANKLIGTIVDTRIIKKEAKNEFWINDKYKAIMPLTTFIYNDIFNNIKANIENLKDGEIVKCEVLSVNNVKKQFILKWLFTVKDDINLFPDEIKELFGTTVTIIIQRKGRKFKYIVNEKYDGIIPITKEIYSEGRNIRQLELNINSLQNGSVIRCEIIGFDIESGRIILKWKRNGKNSKITKGIVYLKAPGWKNRVIIKNSLENILDDTTHNKLLSLINNNNIE